MNTENILLNAKAAFAQGWAAQARNDADNANAFYTRAVALLKACAGSDLAAAVIWREWLQEVSS
jgi:hypothetical protein